MFGSYTTCQTVNKPVHDAVYFRLKSVLRRAVRPGLVSPDWETNLYFCGVVNKYQNNHSAEAALAVIHKRLTAGLRRMKRPNRITYLSLILLETCMKNCGTRFHYVAADEAVFKTLLRLGRPRISGKRMFAVTSSGNYMRDLMEERVLLLIQAWGKAFSDRTTGRMSIYSHYYTQLRSKGVRFPPERPEDEVFSRQEKEAQGRASRNTQMDEDEVKSILNPLKESMDVLEEMLNSLGPRDNPENDAVIQSLVTLCKDAKPRVIKLINKCVDNEGLTEYLMNTFDRLEELLNAHEVKCGRTTGARPLKYETSRPQNSGGMRKSSGKSSRGKQDDSDDDFSDDEGDDDEGDDDDSDDEDFKSPRGSKNVPKEKKGGTLSRKRSTSLPPRVQQQPASPAHQQVRQQEQLLQQQQRASQTNMQPINYQQPTYSSVPQPQSVPVDYQQQQLHLQQQMQRLQIQQQQQQFQHALQHSPATPLSPRGTGGAASPFAPAGGAHPSPVSAFSASAPSLPFAMGAHPSSGTLSPPLSAGSQQSLPQQQYALYQQQQQLQQLQQQQQKQFQQQQQWGQSPSPQWPQQPLPQQPSSLGHQPSSLGHQPLSLGHQPSSLGHQPLGSHPSAFSLGGSDLDFLASMGSQGKVGMSSSSSSAQHPLKQNLTASLPTLPSMEHSYFPPPQQQPFYQQQQQQQQKGQGIQQYPLPSPPAAGQQRSQATSGRY